MAQVFQRLPGQLLRSGRISGLLKEPRLSLLLSVRQFPKLRFHRPSFGNHSLTPVLAARSLIHEPGFFRVPAQPTKSEAGETRIGKEMVLTREDLELLKRLQAAGERGRIVAG